MPALIGKITVKLWPTPSGARALRHDCDELEAPFFRWSGETTLNACLHSGHQNVVAELLPALLRVVNRHDRPAAVRCTGGVKSLALGQTAVARVNGRNRRLILSLSAAWKEM